MNIAHYGIFAPYLIVPGQHMSGTFGTFMQSCPLATPMSTCATNPLDSPLALLRAPGKW